MKSIVLFFLFSLSLLAQDVKVVEHTLNWTGYGAIGGYSLTGDLRIKNATFEKSADGGLISGEIIFDMPSLSHENKQLVRHLKSEDFFHVKKYKTAIFSITEIKDSVMTGTLTMRGVSNPITIPCDIVKSKQSYIISGSATIDRTKFGINHNSNRFFQNLGSQAIKDDFEVKFRLVCR